MKRIFILFAAIFIPAIFFGQTNFWTASASKGINSKISANKASLKNPKLFNLDIEGLKGALKKIPQKTEIGLKSTVITSFPNSDGNFESFKIYENSNFEPELALKFPDIKSYIGISLDKRNKIYFSISPLGLSTMELRSDDEAVFIEPYTSDLSSYVAYKRSEKGTETSKFQCLTDNSVLKNPSSAKSANDGTLRTYRLAMSCTAEYANFFGSNATNNNRSFALAAMNNTMTRVNGVFENDFGVHMSLIGNENSIIYLTASSDPYTTVTSASSPPAAWNNQLQSTLDSIIGSANYDIGHLVGASGGGGNAGCIGCVCTSGTKGSGITSPMTGSVNPSTTYPPSGDGFDIDYVAHEMGHQFGGNHTFTNSSEGTIAQVEPGSGSTIMGYAGITSADVQPHSDPYFSALSIQQITAYVQGTKGSCSVNTASGNTAPTSIAGSNYTIPQNTPFMLTGSGSDANGDAITYCWEEIDVQNAATTNPSPTKTSGPAFRSYNPTSSPVRYFPNMTSVLAGLNYTYSPTTYNPFSSTTAQWKVETLSTVTRTEKFRLTVRDNHAGAGGNNYSDMTVSINSTYGPFTVTSQNTTGVSYPGNSSQTVTWNVASTSTLAANVDILLSIDGGTTWTTLLTATPNDGSQAVILPNTPSTTCRFMVKGNSQIFFNVNTSNFTITLSGPDTQAPTAPTLSASGTTTNSTVLSWSGATDNVGVTAYDIYKDGVLLTTVSASPYTVTGLSQTTTYSFTVIAKDAAGNVSPSSNAVSVTTLAPDTQAPTAPTLSASGTTSSSTILSWSGATDNVGVTAYDIYKNGVLLTTVTSSPFTVTGLTPSTTYSFTVVAKDAAGNVSPVSNSVSVTTSANTYSELYISEYLEGTSNNKAIEISNVTANTIDLSTYSIKQANNGSTSWTPIITLSGTLAPNTAYVIANSSYALTCTGTINVKTANLVFNGNDVVGLFKGTSLVDVVGTLGSSTNFAANTDLRRNVKVPNTTYTVSEWDVFAVDTCDNLGILNPATLNVSDNFINGEQMILLPNPVKGDTIFVKNIKNASDYQIFDTSGKLISKGKLTNGTVSVKGISTGVYLIKIGNSTKRFIKE